MPRYDGGVQLPKRWRLGIIDPFEYTHDLGVVLSEGGMAAFNRELARAASLLCNISSAGPPPAASINEEQAEQQEHEDLQEAQQQQEEVEEGAVVKDAPTGEEEAGPPADGGDGGASPSSSPRYNARLDRWEISIEGVKKVKTVGIELLCEEESSKLVGKVCAIAEGKLRALLQKKQKSKGKKTALFAPFIYKMHYFTKTGSGRT